MSKLTKNQKMAAAKFDATKEYKLAEACDIVKDITFTKFDASVELSVNLGVDPRKANQMVRGVVTLPHGTGKQTRVLVLCTPDKENEAKEAGAEVGTAVKEVKAGKIDFKVAKTGIVHAAIGKVSFTGAQICENAQELISAILKLKPQTLKGTYMKGVSICSTMSPGIHVDVKSVVNSAE